MEEENMNTTGLGLHASSVYFGESTNSTEVEEENMNTTKLSHESDTGRGEEILGCNNEVTLPIEAEVGENMDKPSVHSDKSEAIQDEAISSSTKPTEMLMDEDGFPVDLETMEPCDVNIAEEECPIKQKDDQFDALLVCHERDKEKAACLCNTLCRKKRKDGKQIRISTLDQEVDGKNELDKLEYFFNKSTFLMMLLTENFCGEDNWTKFYQNRMVIESVVTQSKKWCAIPVHTEHWRTPKSYDTPFSLKGMRGICLTDENWEERAVSMIQKKEELLQDREEKEGRDFEQRKISWKKKEQEKRLKQWKTEKATLYIERDKVKKATTESAMEHDNAQDLNNNGTYQSPGQAMGSPRMPRQAWENNPEYCGSQPQFGGQFLPQTSAGLHAPPVETTGTSPLGMSTQGSANNPSYYAYTPYGEQFPMPQASAGLSPGHADQAMGHPCPPGMPRQAWANNPPHCGSQPHMNGQFLPQTSAGSSPGQFMSQSGFPGTSRQTWANNPLYCGVQPHFDAKMPFKGQAGLSPDQGSGMKMTPEQMIQAFQLQQFQMFLLAQQSVQPAYHISANVVNFGDNSQTNVQNSTEEDVDIACNM